MAVERTESVPSRYAGDIVISVLEPNMMDLLKLCSRPRKDDVDQYIELSGKQWDVDEVANDLYSRIGLKFVLLDDDNEPLVAFGLDEILPGVWQTWMIGSQGAWDKHWRAITRNCRKIMNGLMENERVRRIQTIALVSRVETCKWYERGLKMSQESIAKGFGVTGQDIVCYVRLREQ